MNRGVFTTEDTESTEIFHSFALPPNAGKAKTTSPASAGISL